MHNWVVLTLLEDNNIMTIFSWTLWTSSADMHEHDWSCMAWFTISGKIPYYIAVVGSWGFHLCYSALASFLGTAQICKVHSCNYSSGKARLKCVWDSVILVEQTLSCFSKVYNHSYMLLTACEIIVNTCFIPQLHQILSKHLSLWKWLKMTFTRPLVSLVASVCILLHSGMCVSFQW